MKVKNQVIYSDDPAEISRLADEFTFIGREVRKEKNRLIVLALPSKYKAKTRREQKARRKNDESKGTDRYTT